MGLLGFQDGFLDLLAEAGAGAGANIPAPGEAPANTDATQQPQGPEPQHAHHSNIAMQSQESDAGNQIHPNPGEENEHQPDQQNSSAPNNSLPGVSSGRLAAATVRVVSLPMVSRLLTTLADGASSLSAAAGLNRLMFHRPQINTALVETDVHIGDARNTLFNHSASPALVEGRRARASAGEESLEFTARWHRQQRRRLQQEDPGQHEHDERMDGEMEDTREGLEPSSNLRRTGCVVM